MSAGDTNPNLDSIIAEYLESVESGEAPDRDELIGQHPDLAADLKSFFANHDQMKQAARSGEETLRPGKPGQWNEALPPAQNAKVDQTTAAQNVPADDATLPPTRIADDDATIPPSDTQIGVPELGTSVRYFGDYELLDEIARGGMGVVYKARQVNLNRIVALKMILAGQLAGGDDVHRFYAEAEAAANLDHPGIVPIFEVGEFEGQHYFSMGFVEGESLADKIKDGPLPPHEAAKYTKKIAEAIAFAHERGVIHRDLKPANVLLDQNDEPKVTDFGLAKRVEDDSGLTATGQILGTPSYMPPEQASGKTEEVGAAADVYSLGAILYALLSGRPPFQAANPLDTLLQVLEQDPVPPRTLNSKIPLDLETITLKALEKESRKRYASATDLAAELERFLEGRPIVARPVTSVERTWRWCRRNPVVASSLSAAVLSLLIGLVVSCFFAALASNRANSELLERQRAQAREIEARQARQEAQVQSALAFANLAEADYRHAQMLKSAHEPRRQPRALERLHSAADAGNQLTTLAAAMEKVPQEVATQVSDFRHRLLPLLRSETISWATQASLAPVTAIDFCEDLGMNPQPSTSVASPSGVYAVSRDGNWLAYVAPRERVRVSTGGPGRAAAGKSGDPHIELVSMSPGGLKRQLPLQADSQTSTSDVLALKFSADGTVLAMIRVERYQPREQRNITGRYVADIVAVESGQRVRQIILDLDIAELPRSPDGIVASVNSDLTAVLLGIDRLGINPSYLRRSGTNPIFDARNRAFVCSLETGGKLATFDSDEYVVLGLVAEEDAVAALRLKVGDTKPADGGTSSARSGVSVLNYDGSVRRNWQLEESDLDWDGSSFWPNSASWLSPDGRYAAGWLIPHSKYQNASYQVALIDLEEEKLVTIVSLHGDDERIVQQYLGPGVFSDDGRYLFVVLLGTVNVIEASTGKVVLKERFAEMPQLQASANEILVERRGIMYKSSLVIMHSHHRIPLHSRSAGRRIGDEFAIWDVALPRWIPSERYAHRDPLRGCHLNFDGSSLAVIGEQGKSLTMIHRGDSSTPSRYPWVVQDTEHAAKWRLTPGLSRPVGFDSSSRFYLAFQQNDFAVFDVSTGKPIRTLKKAGIREVSPDRRFVAFYNGQSRLLDVFENRIFDAFKKQDYYHLPGFSPTGRYILADIEGEILIAGTGENAARNTVKGQISWSHVGGMSHRAAIFAADEKTALLRLSTARFPGQSSYKLALVALDSGKILHEFAEGDAPLHHIAASNDLTRIVLGQRKPVNSDRYKIERKLTLWEPISNRRAELASTELPSYWGGSDPLYVNGDGTRLVAELWYPPESGVGDGTRACELWDLGKGEQLATRSGLPEEMSVAISERHQTFALSYIPVDKPSPSGVGGGLATATRSLSESNGKPRCEIRSLDTGKILNQLPNTRHQEIGSKGDLLIVNPQRNFEHRLVHMADGKVAFEDDGAVMLAGSWNYGGPHGLIADEQFLLAESNAGDTLVWDLAMQRSHRLNSSRSDLLDVSPDNLHLVAREKSADGKNDTGNLLLWKLADGALARRVSTAACPRPPNGSNVEVREVMFAPDGKSLVCDVNAQLRLLRVSDGKVLASLARSDHLGTVRAAAFQPQGPLVATAGDDATVGFWHVESGKYAGMIEGFRSQVMVVRFADRQSLIVLDQARFVSAWKIGPEEEPNITFRWQQLHDAATDVLVAPDGKLVVLLAGQRINVLAADTGERLRELSCGAEICSAAIHQDSERMVVLLKSGELFHFNLTRNDPPNKLQAGLSDTHTVRLAQQSGLLVTVGNSVKLWSWQDGLTQLFEISTKPAFESAALSGDGKLLVGTAANGHIELWNLGEFNDILTSIERSGAD